MHCTDTRASQSHCEISFTLPTRILARLCYHIGRWTAYSMQLSYESVDISRKERRWSAWRFKPPVPRPLRMVVYHEKLSMGTLLSSSSMTVFILLKPRPPYLSPKLLSHTFLINLIHTCVYSVNLSCVGWVRTSAFMGVFRSDQNNRRRVQRPRALIFDGSDLVDGSYWLPWWAPQFETSRLPI